MAPRRTASLLASAALASASLATGLLVLAPGPAGGQANPCDEPYSPVAFAQAYPAQEELPEVPGDDVTVPVPTDVTIDSDGDGTADAVADGTTQVTITRGDGVVTLTAAGASSVSAYGVGDIDGDGRTELAVSVFDGPDEGTYLVPGTVPTGSAPVASSAVLANEGAGAGLVLVPDGSDRLVVVQPAVGVPPQRGLMVTTATEVLDAGPGGDGSAPSGTYVEGTLEGFADLGDPGLAILVGDLRAFGPDGPLAEPYVVIRVARGTPLDLDLTDLTTQPEPYFPEYVEPVGGVTVIVGPEGTFVRLGQSSPSGSASYLWSLTDPCTPYTGPDGDGGTTTSTVPADTAPPATPVRTTARFTG